MLQKGMLLVWAMMGLLAATANANTPTPTYGFRVQNKMEVNRTISNVVVTNDIPCSLMGDAHQGFPEVLNIPEDATSNEATLWALPPLCNSDDGLFVSTDPSDSTDSSSSSSSSDTAVDPATSVPGYTSSVKVSMKIDGCSDVSLKLVVTGQGSFSIVDPAHVKASLAPNREEPGSYFLQILSCSARAE